MIFTETQAKRILEVVDKGLTQGLGNPIPGQLCVEAAVSLALGLPPGDNPHCVGKKVRKFKIALNDCNWASNASRAAGMRKLAVAQVGSNTIDQQKFSEIIVIETVKQLTPRLFDVLEIKGAKGCRKVKTLEEAQKAAHTAFNAAKTADNAAYTAKAVAKAANVANAYMAAKAANVAEMVTGSQEFLLLSAQIGLDALIQLKSPGCDFLYLCK